jgi:hypothetical protein
MKTIDLQIGCPVCDMEGMVTVGFDETEREQECNKCNGSGFLKAKWDESEIEELVQAINESDFIEAERKVKLIFNV